MIYLTTIADVLPVSEGHLPHSVAIMFLFALGACIGSFLNVVVWRLPRGESLVSPPSHCPKCNKNLKWYDNLPIVGWIKLGGKCRFCKLPISIRYPTVELITALIFVFYYVMYYMVGVGPTSPIPTLRYADAPGSIIYSPPGWPILLLHLFAVSCLLAAGLIDAELYEIPMPITLTLALVAIASHAIYDEPRLAGSISAVRLDYTASTSAALGAGGAIGLLISIVLRKFDILKASFPNGEPEVGVEHEGRSMGEGLALLLQSLIRLPLTILSAPGRIRKSAGQFLAIRKPLLKEMSKEMAFLTPPIVLGVGWMALTEHVPSIHAMWYGWVRNDWVSGLTGALFGGLVGGFVIWVTRILGTLGFGKVAMGLGDADLMFAVGATIGAAQATVAFFIAPFFGMILAIYYQLTGKRNELPFGPYLAIASAAVMFVYGPIAAWLRPGIAGLGYIIQEWLNGDTEAVIASATVVMRSVLM